MAKTDKLRKEIRDLKAELERKDAVLKSYADHRNWVKPNEVRERLGVPPTDPSGNPIEDPVQCFVGARYPWEPALKILIGVEQNTGEEE